MFLQKYKKPLDLSAHNSIICVKDIVAHNSVNDKGKEWKCPKRKKWVDQ